MIIPDRIGGFVRTSHLIGFETEQTPNHKQRKGGTLTSVFVDRLDNALPKTVRSFIRIPVKMNLRDLSFQGRTLEGIGLIHLTAKVRTLIMTVANWSQRSIGKGSTDADEDSGMRGQDSSLQVDVLQMRGKLRTGLQNVRTKLLQTGFGRT